MQYILRSAILMAALLVGCTQLKSQQSADIVSLDPSSIEIMATSAQESAPSLLDKEFAALFGIGFFQTFLYYYSCDLRVDWTYTDAFVHCLAGGLIAAGASRVGSLPKLTTDNWTKSEVLRQALLFFGVQGVARLICMLQLLSPSSDRQQPAFESRFKIGYDLVTYALLAGIPLWARYKLQKKLVTPEVFLPKNLVAAH